MHPSAYTNPIPFPAQGNEAYPVRLSGRKQTSEPALNGKMLDSPGRATMDSRTASSSPFRGVTIDGVIRARANQNEVDYEN